MEFPVLPGIRPEFAVVSLYYLAFAPHFHQFFPYGSNSPPIPRFLAEILDLPYFVH